MIYFDLETTGLRGEEHDIIEIYLLKENANGEIIDELHFYVNTRIKLDPYIVNLTKIDNNKLQNEKYFEEIASVIVNFIGNEILVGHNIDGFDFPFLNANLIKKNFSKLNNKTIDTMLLARKIANAGRFDKGYKLIDLCKKYQLIFDESKMHGAKYDTLLTRQLYKVLTQQAK